MRTDEGVALKSPESVTSSLALAIEGFNPKHEQEQQVSGRAPSETMYRTLRPVRNKNNNVPPLYRLIDSRTDYARSLNPMRHRHAVSFSRHP